MIRPLEKQFEPETVERIRKLQTAFESLPFQGEAARYFTSQVVGCLEAGLLLGAVLVGLCLLELFFRELLICVRFEKVYDIGDAWTETRRKLDAIREDVEDGSQLSLYYILDELLKSAVVDKEDAARIKGFYKRVRIPMQHAVIRRFLFQSESARWGGPPQLTAFGVPFMVSLHQVDETIELDALEHLECIVGFIGKHC